MKKLLLSLATSILLSAFFCGCIENGSDDKGILNDNDKLLIKYDSNTLNSRFGFMHPDNFQDMTDLGIFWQRPHPGPFIWGQIEKGRITGFSLGGSAAEAKPQGA